MSQQNFTHPLDDPAADPFEIAATAAAEIAERTGVEKHDIALTLGSGWAKAADLIGETTATIPALEITGFGKPALSGHVGTLRSVLLPSGKRALIIGARTHYYDGYGVRRVVHSVRTAAATGASTMILTNGAGGIRETWSPGTPVLISDMPSISIPDCRAAIASSAVDMPTMCPPMAFAICTSAGVS